MRDRIQVFYQDFLESTTRATINPFSTSDRVERRSLRDMVFIWSNRPESRLQLPDGGISKESNALFIPCSGIPRSRLVDSRHWLDSPFDTQGRDRIRHYEANRYCAVFLAELPNGLQIASLNSNEGDEMNSDYVFLCGVMWCRYGKQEAGRELLRAALSRDPDISTLAWAMFARGKTALRKKSVGEHPSTQP